MTLAEFARFLGPFPIVALLLGLLLIPAVFFVLLRAETVSVAGLLKLQRRIETTANDLDNLSIAMAEARIVELEVAVRQMISPLSEGDRAELRREIEKLKEILKRMKRT